MTDIDVIGHLRRLYGGLLQTHYDLYEKSNTHREQHGDGCTVYPSSPATAPLWFFLAGLVEARRFLEVGCGLGYTAAVMAEAGGASARVDTIEAVKEHAELAEAELARRGLTGQVHVLRGHARTVLPGLAGPYDVVFVDADWEEYPHLLADLTRLTRHGGMLVTSNLFPLFEEWAEAMPGKDAIRQYLETLIGDRRFRTYIIPGQWQALSYRLPP